MQAEAIPAAVWRRVSTTEQQAENQAPAMERFAAHHGYVIRRTYALDDSAWHSKTDSVYQAALGEALDDAWRGEFKVLIIWSLDRLTRGGAEDALRLLRKFRERSTQVISIQEPWLNGSPEVQDVLVAFAGWMAQQESARKSERVRAGLARRKAAGLPVGRQPGAVDLRPRKRAGYVARWDGERGRG